ncbi:hypothetical protein AB1K70_21020 [Bremerella sp. JC770]|uniref:hypothetical protein n=1 Tax=Bremerella sp. JC770 TaxID=3232137 RepID=UPI003459E467
MNQHRAERRIASLMLFALVGILAGGCSSAKTPPLAPVTGVVTIGGVPLEGAHVSFVPVGGIRFVEEIPHGRESLALTDNTGFFRLTHHSGKGGAELGEHQVTVEIPGKKISEIPDGTSAREIYDLTTPTRVDMGEQKVVTVGESVNVFEFALSSDALPADGKQRQLRIYREHR